MGIVSVTSAGVGRVIVTFDGTDEREKELDMAMDAPGIPKIEKGKCDVKEGIRISKNKIMVAYA